jgi:hypothetical protein
MRTGRRRKKMMTTKFRNIRTLDDIQRAKRRLGKKLRVTENSISKKTDLKKLLLDSTESMGSFFGNKNMNIERLEYLLPLGVNYILRLIKSKPTRKQIKRLSIYSGIGSVLALLVYQYLGKRKT